MTIFESNLQPSLDFGGGIGFYRDMPDTFDLSDITMDMVREGKAFGGTEVEYKMVDAPEYRTKDGIRVVGFGYMDISSIIPYVQVILPISNRSKNLYGKEYNVILPRWVRYDADRVLASWKASNQ